MEFTICGHIETVSDDELHAHTIHAQFEHRAQAAQDLYQRKYEGYQSWGTFVTSAPKDGYGIIADELEYCVKSLVAAGKYNISSDYLYQKYGELILEPWDDLIDEICHLLEEVNGVEAQARYAREVRRASRGQVVGGGFGVSGAVKGMAFAGAANMATGAAHSIANAIGNAKTRNEIARREAELYQDNDFKKSVCERIYYAVERIGGCMIVELGIDGENVPPRDRQTAINLMKNYPIVPQKDRLEVLLHALNCDRYNLQVYEHLILEFRDSEEAVKIGKLFGLGAKMDEICSRVLCNYFPPRPKLAAKSLQQKTDLLKGYRLKKAKLGVYKEFPEVHELEAAIIQEFVPEGWETMEPADIPGLLAEIQQKKQEYEIDSECVVEQTLKKNFLRAKTVNGKLYSTLEEAK